MKLGKKQVLFVSFMLFSLFFGAGNLIFPPFLGQNAGNQTPLAMLGFLVTAVALPVLGVVVVAQFDGLSKLASRVNSQFALIFTILIYVSIGPGLGIPRAASLPFEMAVAPYLPSDAPLKLWMILFSFIFFVSAIWLALTPNKLVERMGKFLTPSLLILLVFLFISFVLNGEHRVAVAQEAYQASPLIKGFLGGYLTMDTIAALNFGIVIATTIRLLGVEEKTDVMHHTLLCGLFAGFILAVVYIMLAYMGMNSSAVFALGENGAWTLRCIVDALFGNLGAILLAAIFTLACLTTCVGLITSCSQYFSTLSKKISYRQWVLLISTFSFIVCNQGLNTILSVSVPILNAIYPISIMLIILGLCDRWFHADRMIYPCTIIVVGVISCIDALEQIGIHLGVFTQLCHILPFYSEGLGWLMVAVVVILASRLAYHLRKI